MRYKKLWLIAIVSILSMIFCMLFCSCQDMSSIEVIIKYYKNGKVYESVMNKSDKLPVQEGKEGYEFFGYVGSLEDSDYLFVHDYSSDKCHKEEIDMKVDSKGNVAAPYKSKDRIGWDRLAKVQNNKPLCPIWVKEKRCVEVVTYDIGDDGNLIEQHISDFMIGGEFYIEGEENKNRTINAVLDYYFLSCIFDNQYPNTGNEGSDNIKHYNFLGYGLSPDASETISIYKLSNYEGQTLYQVLKPRYWFFTFYNDKEILDCSSNYIIKSKKGIIDFSGMDSNVSYSLTIDYNDTIPAISYFPEKAGYKFMGWREYVDDIQFTNANNEVIDEFRVFDQAALSSLMGGIKNEKEDMFYFYPIFEPKEFHITFSDTFSGTTKNTIAEYDYNSVLNSFDTPVQTGEQQYYNFDGWTYDYLGNEPVTFPLTLDDEAPEDITVYAKWSPKDITISFNLNGGTAASAVPSINVKYGDRIDGIPFNISKDKYRFLGWFGSDSEDAIQYTTNQILLENKRNVRSEEFNIVNDAITFVARYNNQYTIIYNLNIDGMSLYVVKLDEGQLIAENAPETITQIQGKRLLRWVDGDDNTVTTATRTMTVYAVWEDINDE